MMFGMLPSSAMICNLDTASTLPTMSLMTDGRYFSTCCRRWFMLSVLPRPNHTHPLAGALTHGKAYDGLQVALPSSSMAVAILERSILA